MKKQEYDIIYTYDDGDNACDLRETFRGTREEMLAFIEELKECGYYNIDAYAYYDEEA